MKALPGYTLIGPLTYRGKGGCQNVTCTRHRDILDRCMGWHCVYCDAACSYQGHGCDVAEAVLGEAARLAAPPEVSP